MMISVIVITHHSSYGHKGPTYAQDDVIICTCSYTVHDRVELDLFQSMNEIASLIIMDSNFHREGGGRYEYTYVQPQHISTRQW